MYSKKCLLSSGKHCDLSLWRCLFSMRAWQVHSVVMAAMTFHQWMNQLRSRGILGRAVSEILMVGWLVGGILFESLLRWSEGGPFGLGAFPSSLL